MRIFLMILLLLATPAFAQFPHAISFQGVARDASGKYVVNQSVKLRFSFHKSSVNGPIVYQEEQSAQTGPFGVFNAVIGSAPPLIGVFLEIDWNDGQYFLQVELDPTGGNAFVNVGTSQLLSVPYALYAKEAASWKHGDPIVQKGTLGQGDLLSNPSPGTKLIWYPRRGAFRVGGVTNDAWNDLQIGEYSIGMGSNTRASGSSSIALGYASEALNTNAVAIGTGVSAKNIYSVALGAFNSNDGFPGNLVGGWDRIFEIGNGKSQNERSNAVTVLRNGCVGIGENALYPEYRLDVGHRMRIRHNSGETAGLYLDGSQTDDEAKGPAAFMGMVNDQQVGFYIGNAWRFYVHANGSATLSGSLSQNSDLRLKKQLTPLRESKSRLLGLTGYHYLWKDPRRSEAMQTGLIAQEVEKVFPELVETNPQGEKSVNYIGLIPHLIEAIKELQKENVQIKARLNAAGEKTFP